MKVFLLGLLLLITPAMITLANDRIIHPHRSSTVLHAFQHGHPCPSTGSTRGACPGYVKDHVRALCDGGADAVANLQWQTVADAKAKDRTECRH